MKLLEKLQIQETDIVLDLGCGTGRLTNNIVKRVSKGEVIGIDPDKERIKIAMAESTGDNLQFMIASDQSFPENQYDHVVSTDARLFIGLKTKKPLLIECTIILNQEVNSVLQVMVVS